mgnify:CR=1 FL=1
MTNRIVVDPKILSGKEVVKGTRIPVYVILNLLAHGKKPQEITKEYPELTTADVFATMEYSLFSSDILLTI